MNIEKVLICEVSPRDGLQNVEDFVPTETKIDLIRRCVGAGAKYVQATSFMSPKAVPQMRDAQQVAETALAEFPNVRFNTLVPNLFGARRAWECGVREITAAFSLSEAHNKANINRTCEESFEEIARIRDALPDMYLIFGIGTAFGCPWEGEMHIDQVMDAVRRGLAIGVNGIELADPIGVAYPVQVEKYFKTVYQEFPGLEVGVHIHDTRNMGIVSTWTAIQNGASYIHSSVGGLGGCPFAPGASGNIATEDLVFMLDRCGIETGIDYQKILETARFAERNVHGCFGSHQLLVPQDTYAIK